MPLPRREGFTTDYIYSLPQGERAELIDGQLYNMAPPGTKHQHLVNYINTEINLYIRSNNGSCEVFPYPLAVFLNADDKTYVEPDISVICDPDKLTDKGCNGAPDWIVDPNKNHIMVWNFEVEDTSEYTFSDTVRAGIYKDLHIDLTKLDI